MNQIQQLQKLLTDFRKARDWEQFHNPKDLSLSLVLESSEVLEHFQWKNGTEITKHCETHKTEIGEELADVFYWTLLLANDLKIDLDQALRDKISKNELRYSVEKAKGNHKKYTEL